MTLSGRSGHYIPLVDVRTTLTGVSSRISTTSLLPDEAAARASAVRDKDDDFGFRSPPNIDWLNISYLRLFRGLLTSNRLSQLRREGSVSFRMVLERTICSLRGSPHEPTTAFIIDIPLWAAGIFRCQRCANRGRATGELDGSGSQN